MKISKELKDSGKPPRSFDPEHLRLQRELKAVGHYNGALDGKLGPSTTQAIQAYAKWRNKAKPLPKPPLREDGVVDAHYAKYLNWHFYATDLGKIVRDREDSLALKDLRIKQIRAKLGEKPGAKRELELRTRLHKWLTRKAEELEKGLFDGLQGYDRVALLPRDLYATDLLAMAEHDDPTRQEQA